MYIHIQHANASNEAFKWHFVVVTFLIDVLMKLSVAQLSHSRAWQTTYTPQPAYHARTCLRIMPPPHLARLN